MVEELLNYLKTIPPQQLLPIVLALFFGLWCIILGVLAARWKRKYYALTLSNSLLEERLSLEQQHRLERESQWQTTSSELKLQFRDLAQRIFDEKSRTFSSQNSEKLDILLRPFREQIDSFRDRVDTIFVEETRERASLKQEILHLRDLNQQINEEARNLSQAIAGNRQTQGAWGELILEKLLEQSGLRKGHEYETQKGLRDNHNHLFKPDIIIHLPDGKDIVIDSKVSLSAWSRYVSAGEPEEAVKAMREHLLAMKNHIKTLSTKDYSSLKGLQSLDFVLMFVPIDAAFITATQTDETLISEMYSHKIIIVTPTTLLATLRIIEHIWQLERQNHNAVEIANRASLLYDKLRGFLEDMDKLGKQLDISRDSYDRAMNKLSRGRGNLVSQASHFPELGIQVKKEIAKELLPRAESE
jgi:DNA recombination protein RmuC